MHARDAKTQKIEPDVHFVMTDESFGGSVNLIDTTWGIYFFMCENIGLRFGAQWPLEWYALMNHAQ